MVLNSCSREHWSRMSYTHETHIVDAHARIISKHLCVCHVAYGFYYLVKVVKCCMQIGQHSSWRLVGDFDGIFQNALRNDVFLGISRWLCAHKHSVVWVTVLTASFQKLLQTS